jgi:hypothetical protein
MKRPLLRKKYVHGGRLKIEVHVSFYRENSRTIALIQTMFCCVKDHGDTSFVSIIVFFNGAL